MGDFISDLSPFLLNVFRMYLTYPPASIDRIIFGNGEKIDIVQGIVACHDDDDHDDDDTSTPLFREEDVLFFVGVGIGVGVGGAVDEEDDDVSSITSGGEKMAFSSTNSFSL